MDSERVIFVNLLENYKMTFLTYMVFTSRKVILENIVIVFCYVRVHE